MARTPSLGFELLGTRTLLTAFDAMIANALVDAGREGWVTSVVVYGPVHEFGGKGGRGHSRLPARPHWRPAMAELAGRAGPNPLSDEQWIDLLILPGQSLVGELANRYKLAVRRHIRRQGVIDTRNYHNSVQAGKTRREAINRSLSFARPETVGPI